MARGADPTSLRFLWKRSLGGQLARSFALIIFPLVGLGLVGIVVFQTAASSFERVSAEVVRQQVMVGELHSRLLEAEGLAADYWSTGDPAAAARFGPAKEAVRRGFLELYRVFPADQRGVARAAHAKWDRAEAVADAVLAGPGRLAPVAPSSLEAWHKGIEQAQATIHMLSSDGLQRIEDEMAAIHARGGLQVALLVSGVLLSLLGARVLARRLHRSIHGPLLQLEDAARRLGDDDLSHRVDLGADHELGRVASAFNAMAERLASSRQALMHQALYDSLTGLANRSLLVDRVEHALARAQRLGGRPAVLVLDLDDFRTVNDSLGHAAGDKVLVEVADRLRRLVRQVDTVARLGGDEFAVLLEDVDGPNEPSLVAARIIAALAQPMEVGGQELFISVSVGGACGAGTDSSAEAAGALLRGAEVAMYRAKADGLSGHRMFEPEMQQQAIERLALAADLRQSLSRQEIAVHYQPVVDISDGSVVGVEALARWKHPLRGMVPPRVFIPLAEETGLIVPAGLWVLREACRHGRRLQQGWPREQPLSVSVNVSLRQLMEPGFPEQVGHILRDTGFSPGSLVLEITESVLMRDVDLTLTRLSELKRLGVRLAVDDFGTGHSSLSYLRRLPVDVLKVDKSFVDGLQSDSATDLAVASAIVKLGQELHLEVVAEGIERPEQLARLQELGCPLGQGFLLARPLEVEDLDELLETTGGHLGTAKALVR